MITLAQALRATGGAHSGIDPVNLLDVLDVNGQSYFWSDRPVNAPKALEPVEAVGSPLLTVPVVLESGQFATWAFPTAGDAVGQASYVAAGASSTGQVGQTFRGPFTGPNRVTFSNFQPSTLPPGAIVDACYLVCNFDYDTDPPVNDFGITSAIKSGQISAVCGPPGVGSSFSASYRDTVAPSPGDPGYLGIFLGLEAEQCNFNAIGICVIYHLSDGGGETGSLPFGRSSQSGVYLPWILSVPQITFNRSLQTDVGSFVLQNLSGDVLSRDFERIMRRSALEGAFFIYRIWDAAARASWLEMHGTFTVEGFTDTVTLKGSQLLNSAQEDTPSEIYCETCQNRWGKARCGSRQPTECQYSFQTCQVPERFRGFLNSYETNYGESIANVATRPTNRRRKI